MRFRHVGILAATAVASLVLVSTSFAAAPTLTASGSTISWTAVSGTTEYQVGLSPVSPEKCGLEPCFTQGYPGTTLSANEAGIENGWTYAYKVREKKPVIGEWSNTVEISYPVGGSTAEVSSAPAGVPVPSGGWHVVYADAFQKTLAEDGTQHAEERGTSRGCCGNSNEVAYEREAQVNVTPEGLVLSCKFIGGTGLQYECGGTSGDTATHPMEVTLAGPQTVAVDCYCKWPVDEGGADPGFWWYTSSMEVDFFEGWGWNGSGTWATATGGMPVVVTPYKAHELSPVTTGLGFDPSAALHHYTTVFTPSGSETLVSEYIDGAFRWSFTDKLATTKDGLLLTNALRERGGTSPFVIRSLAVYEDQAHAGVGVTGGGVASGTVVK